MDIGDAVTVTKLTVENVGENCYLMVAWLVDSFDIYLFNKDKLYKGRFSPNRLAGFSRNLHLTEVEYFNSIKYCLSQERENYCYELKSEFFYWKRKVNNSIIIEGFLPVEIQTSLKNQPDLVEILLTLNVHLKKKVSGLTSQFQTIKTDYQKCLQDTEEFLNLKIDMEKALCDKFLSLINVKKALVGKMKVPTNDLRNKPKKETGA